MSSLSDSKKLPSALKLSPDQITRFLELFKEHIIVWHRNHPDCMDINKKNEVWMKLSEEMGKCGITRIIILKELKNILEMWKMIKSKTNGSEAGDLDAPTLEWVKTAESVEREMRLPRISSNVAPDVSHEKLQNKESSGSGITEEQGNTEFSATEEADQLIDLDENEENENCGRNETSCSGPKKRRFNNVSREIQELFRAKKRRFSNTRTRAVLPKDKIAFSKLQKKITLNELQRKVMLSELLQMEKEVSVLKKCCADNENKCSGNIFREEVTISEQQKLCETSNNMGKTSASINTPDEYDVFTSHVASQLRQLPIRSYLKLQENFQSQITQERIACLAIPSTSTSRN